MIKRVFLFILTNILVMATLSIVLNVLGVQPYLQANGIDYKALLIFCGVYGMGGAFISLAISKLMAKWMMGVRIIDPNTNDLQMQQLVQTVHRLAQGAGLPKMPEVGIYDSPEVNAFATGPSKSNSLVAVSTGLLSRMKRAEVEGVLGHEVAHIANGDMVTMTLIQGVVNAFTMFLARIVAFAVSNVLRSEDDKGPSPMINFLLVMVFDIVFTLLGSMVVAWFSRQREFRADAGGAALAGRDKMVNALKALSNTEQLVDNGHPAMASLKISGARGGILALLMSHPPLEKRIERLVQSSVSSASLR